MKAVHLNRDLESIGDAVEKRPVEGVGSESLRLTQKHEQILCRGWNSGLNLHHTL